MPRHDEYALLHEATLQEHDAIEGGTSGKFPTSNNFEWDAVSHTKRWGSLSSRPLSGSELATMHHTTGYMPQLAYSKPGKDTNSKIKHRVADLDSEFQDRLREICDALLESGNHQDSGAVCRLWESFLQWLRKHIRFGVIGEIVPQLTFFFVYSNLVTYYVSLHDWETRWTAQSQDAIYYPAVVLAFLLCFRASGCMDRYKEGMRTLFEMEKTLREIVFQVLTHMTLEAPDGNEDGQADQAAKVSRAVKMRYFKHEFRRLVRLLFTCAARDLNDSALEEDSEVSEEDAMQLGCELTEVEHAAIMITHATHGHAFRVYLCAAWLHKLVAATEAENFFDSKDVTHMVENKLGHFKSMWLDARQVAYSSMPGSVTHILWLLTTVMNFFMPWEWVSVCQWWTWFPSVLLTISFYGILQIANSMENPFGFDDDDIQVWEMGKHLDEEIVLIMHYAVLDEVGGENLYRALHGDDMVFLHGDYYGLSG
eukprot:TRINITY_DN90749_c0_g1_i1.p1 TRINITY_DN90749_c0_g1~~TRINITY_DN90749_c0_g1_i1.p1  ORF type:complete len:481 (-),score=99.56 TRINITY_DN90749_c0_g1_i1:277-1719(-)